MATRKPEAKKGDVIKKKPLLKKQRLFGGVTEAFLPNGLRVLHKFISGAPVAAICVTFHVGSRNEAPGHTGSTHILEHLLFKDTKNYNKKKGNAPKDYLEWYGAIMNATTWFDRTNYYEILPTEHLEKALAFEADRMRNIRFTAEDLASEMTVVRNEYETSRNNAYEALDEAVMEAAYTTHPYRIPTIGTKEDIEGATIEKLYEFYNTFYWPNNATLQVFGNVRYTEAAALIEKHFAPIPKSTHEIPVLTVTEPIQRKARAVSVDLPFGDSAVQLTYHVPPASHPDHAALYALEQILAGTYASRLRKSLIHAGLANNVSANLFSLHDAAPFSITAALIGKTSPTLVAEKIRTELTTLAEKGPTKRELDAVREHLATAFAVMQDGALNEAFTVSEAIAAGDWTSIYRIIDEIQALKPKDIQRVAATYFTRENETCGILRNRAPREPKVSVNKN